MADEAQKKIAGDVYGPTLAGMLSEESARKASIEQRAISVITTSGGLVSLLVALAAFLLGKDATFVVGTFSRYALIAAVLLFVLAAVLALVVNAPGEYRTFAPTDIARMLDEWASDADEAQRLVFRAHADFNHRANEKNSGKARLLQLAVLSEVLGVSAVALAVVAALV